MTHGVKTMDREEIRKHVEGVIGVILVDKSVIQEDSTLTDLVLDSDDIDQIFRSLADKGIVISQRARTSARNHPERMTLKLLVDGIWKPDAQ
jgi:hypothetical protein